MAIHSSTIAWKIPWTEEPGRLQSMGLKRVRHDWATSLSLSLSYLSKERMLVLIRVDSHQLINKLLSPLSTHECCCCCLVAKSCLSLCDPIDHSPPGSSVRGTSRARTLEWVAISSSRGSSQIRDRTHISFIGRQVLYQWPIREAQVLYVLGSKHVRKERRYWYSK